MSTLVVTEQRTLDGGTVRRSRFSFGPGEIDGLRTIADGQRVECENCESVGFERPDKDRQRVYFNADYFDPWQPLDAEPQYKRTLCIGCIDRGYDRGYSDFDPEYCERCERDVIQRCPSNGWRSYFMSDPEYPEEMCCVGCFQRFILEHGIPRERFEDGRIFCDFYNRSDLVDAGFVEYETLTSARLDTSTVEKFCQAMIGLIDAGYAVAIDQGPTGIGNGGPDWVDVWVKATDAGPYPRCDDPGAHGPGCECDGGEPVL